MPNPLIIIIVAVAVLAIGLVFSILLSKNARQRRAVIAAFVSLMVMGVVLYIVVVNFRNEGLFPILAILCLVIPAALYLGLAVPVKKKSSVAKNRARRVDATPKKSEQSTDKGSRDKLTVSRTQRSVQKAESTSLTAAVPAEKPQPEVTPAPSVIRTERDVQPSRIRTERDLQPSRIRTERDVKPNLDLLREPVEKPEPEAIPVPSTIRTERDLQPSLKLDSHSEAEPAVAAEPEPQTEVQPEVQPEKWSVVSLKPEPDVQPDTQPAEQPVEAPAEQPVSEPEVQPAEEPAVQPEPQPAEESVPEPEVQPAEEPEPQPAEEPAETPAEEPAEQPAEEPAETPAEQPEAETPLAAETTEFDTYYAKAESFAQKGLHSVAGKLFEESATLTSEAQLEVKAILAAMNAYLRAGKKDDVRRLALTVKDSGALSSAQESKFAIILKML